MAIWAILAFRQILNQWISVLGLRSIWMGRWFSLDARHNVPLIGRIVLARGRDATDIPLIHSFGQHELKRFKVWTEDIGALASKRPGECCPA
jgi:transglutaminase-like putative cysteine protease